MVNDDDDLIESDNVIMRAIKKYTPLNGAPYENDKKAHFFDYMAKACPGKFIKHRLSVRAINGLSRTPAVGSPSVEQFASSLSGVRAKLLKVYNRDLYNVAGSGARATFDETDRLGCHRKFKERAASSVDKAVVHASTIDADKIDKKFRADFIESRKALGATSESVTRLMKLLPAPPPTDEKK